MELQNLKENEMLDQAIDALRQTTGLEIQVINSRYTAFLIELMHLFELR